MSLNVVRFSKNYFNVNNSENTGIITIGVFMLHETLKGASNRSSLRTIVDEMLFMERQFQEGIEIDTQEIIDSEVELQDKLDATIYVIGQMEKREEFLKESKTLIDQELKFTQKERYKLKDMIANELDRLDIKSIMTKLHRVTVRLSNWSLTPINSKSVKDKKELRGIDERCITETVSYRASSTLAKEIFNETGEAPEGFMASRKLSCIYKKGKVDEQSENSDE